MTSDDSTPGRSNLVDPSEGDGVEEPDEGAELRLRDTLAFTDELSKHQITVTKDPGNDAVYYFSLPGYISAKPFRVVEYSSRTLLEAQAQLFENATSFEAIWDPTTNSIECAVILGSQRTNEGEPRPWDLPGVVFHSPAEREPGTDLDFDPLEMVAQFTESQLNWSLSVERNGVEITLGPPTPPFFALYSSFDRVPLSIRARGAHWSKQIAIETLLSTCRDYLINLDLAFAANLQLKPRIQERQQRNERRSSSPIPFPGSTYSMESRDLYNYASTVSEFPLVQFLAFYQILEHNFFRFSRNASIRAARNILRDPGFDIFNDANLASLISATETPPTQKREADLLVETLKLAVDARTLSDFIGDPVRTEFLTKKSALRGVQPIDVADGLVHGSVSARIYTIRNRIVHAKEYDSRGKIEPLFPSSPESALLGPDIELLRWIAQRALIFSAEESSPV